MAGCNAFAYSYLGGREREREREREGEEEDSEAGCRAMKVCEHVASWRVVNHTGISEGLFSLRSAAVEDKVGR